MSGTAGAATSVETAVWAQLRRTDIGDPQNGQTKLAMGATMRGMKGHNSAPIRPVVDRAPGLVSTSPCGRRRRGGATAYTPCPRTASTDVPYLHEHRIRPDPLQWKHFTD